MIIFYNKQSGHIKGVIEGRIHSKEHLNMWIGSKKENGRLIINWKKNDEGVYEPDIRDKKQRELLKDVDKKHLSIYDLSIDTNKKHLIKAKEN